MISRWYYQVVEKVVFSQAIFIVKKEDNVT